MKPSRKGKQLIHYHGTPCSGSRQDTARFLSGRHAMVPFPNPDDLGAALDVCSSVVLDNGAFTVWKQGGKLDVVGYGQWVGTLRHHPAFDWAVIPDVIDGDEDDNNRLIAEWPYGRDGIPVWHLHESLDRLRWLAGCWPRVALGSSGKWAGPGTAPWWRRMSEAMNAIDIGEGRPMCRLHGLRMLAVDIFTRLPLASADSTNAARNSNLVGRFGSYPPPTQAQRMAVIADRIECHQSAARWKAPPYEPCLW